MENIEVEQSTKRLIDSLKQACGSKGLGNDGSEYKIIVQMFLYKYFNDKFGYEVKKLNHPLAERLRKADKWDAEYDTFSEDDAQDLFDFLPSGTPRLLPRHTLAHLFNAQQQASFGDLLDGTMVEIATINEDIFSMATVSNNKIRIFEPISRLIPDKAESDEFAASLVKYLADPKNNFEAIFEQKYDFFSTMFEYLIKDYNKDGGGKYAEYYTPKSIAAIMARMLVGDEEDLRSVSCYDPSAGSGTLLMALAHQIGEERCTIYSQDISQKSSAMLRLNLILNNLVPSIQNIVQGNTLLNPAHREPDGTPKKFDFIISNPPFKLDFPDERDKIAADKLRFWAGVPNAPKEINPDKPSMKIFLCFIQHMLYSLKANGRGAIVVPTGFITASQSIEQKILKHIVDDHIIFGCVSMPSNVFATTGTNVSVLFFDKRAKHDKVILIDASKLGEDYKDGNNQRHRLSADDINLIVDTFRKQEAVEDFSVLATFDEIKEKKYSLSAGQYFDVKIEYQDITEDEFNSRMTAFKNTFAEQLAEGQRLGDEIMKQLNSLKFEK